MDKSKPTWQTITNILIDNIKEVRLKNKAVNFWDDASLIQLRNAIKKENMGKEKLDDDALINVFAKEANKTKTKTKGVLKEVRKERVRQDALWGEQDNTAEEWMVILMEEVGEVCREIQDMTTTGKFDNYREELIQVAAVAVSAVECFDRQMKLYNKG